MLGHRQTKWWIKCEYTLQRLKISITFLLFIRHRSRWPTRSRQISRHYESWQRSCALINIRGISLVTAPVLVLIGLQSGHVVTIFPHDVDDFSCRLFSLSFNLWFIDKWLCSWASRWRTVANHFNYPADTRRKNNIIGTSKWRRFDVIMTLLLHREPVGYMHNIIYYNTKYAQRFICYYVIWGKCRLGRIHLPTVCRVVSVPLVRNL